MAASHRVLLDGNQPDQISEECVICLEKVETTNKAVVQDCLHFFCFECVREWIKVRAACPLCIQPIRSIIYNIRASDDYDFLPVEPRTGDSLSGCRSSGNENRAASWSSDSGDNLEYELPPDTANSSLEIRLDSLDVDASSSSSTDPDYNVDENSVSESHDHYNETYSYATDQSTYSDDDAVDSSSSGSEGDNFYNDGTFEEDLLAEFSNNLGEDYESEYSISDESHTTSDLPPDTDGDPYAEVYASEYSGSEDEAHTADMSMDWDEYYDSEYNTSEGSDDENPLALSSTSDSEDDDDYDHYEDFESGSSVSNSNDGTNSTDSYADSDYTPSEDSWY